MSNTRFITVLLILSIISITSCQNRSAASFRANVEKYVQNNTNFIVHPVSDSSIIREGYYGFPDSAIPEEFFIKDPIVSYNTLVKIPRRSIVTKKEWTPNGYYLELLNGHALCFHDTTSLAYMLVENGNVKNTIEYIIDAAITRDLFDSSVVNYNNIQAYKDYGCVHGNVKSVKERGYHIVQKFGKPVKEVNYTSDYAYDEKGRLLSYYYKSGNPNDVAGVCFQTDKEYTYNSDGSFTVKTIRREKFPRGRLQVSSKSFCGYDANGRYTYEYNDNGTIKCKYEYVESIEDGSSYVDQYSNGKLTRRTIKTESPDGSYREVEYNGDGTEQCALTFGPSGVLVKKRSASKMDEQCEIKYDEFNQLNIFRTGLHGEKWWRTKWPSDGLETYDCYGNIIESISIYDVDDYSDGHIIRTSWESYEYTYDSFGNWITREKKDRFKDEPYINVDYYNKWVSNYLSDYSFRGNNISGFHYSVGSDAHVERDIEYY